MASAVELESVPQGSEPDFSENIRRSLIEMRSDLLDRVLAADSALRGRPFDGMDEGDLAVLNLEGELTAELQRRDLERLQVIDSTLVRLRTGHYGNCRRCGEPIAKERLLAIPYATLCCRCQKDLEAGRI